MLLVVGRNYQRNIFLRRIKNRRTGNLYNSQFRQANQQTPSVHTMPQHGTNTARAISTLPSWASWGPRRRRPRRRTSPACGRDPEHRSSQHGKQIAGETKRMRREHGSWLTSACIRSCGCARRRRPLRPAPGWTPAQNTERWRERRGEEEAGTEEQGLGGKGEGGTRVARRRVSEREAGRRPATAERGHAAAIIAVPTACRCRVHPLLCSSSGLSGGRSARRRRIGLGPV